MFIDSWICYSCGRRCTRMDVPIGNALLQVHTRSYHGPLTVIIEMQSNPPMILGQSCTNSNGLFRSYSDCRHGYLQVGDPPLRVVRLCEFIGLPNRYHRSDTIARHVGGASVDSQATRPITELGGDDFEAFMEELAMANHYQQYRQLKVYMELVWHQ